MNLKWCLLPVSVATAFSDLGIAIKNKSRPKVISLTSVKPADFVSGKVSNSRSLPSAGAVAPAKWLASLGASYTVNGGDLSVARFEEEDEARTKPSVSLPTP